MSSLVQFLRENPVDSLTKDIVVSERLKDFTFKIKAMNSKEHSEYSDKCTNISKDGSIHVDNDKLAKVILSSHCVEPNFKSGEDIKAAGCNTPDEYIDKCLLAGEQQKIANEISRLSGFGMSLNDLRNEVKN